MFGKMRRKDREINDINTIRSIIEKSAVCRLGMNHEDRPYIIPLSFGFDGDCLYFHGALKGLKIDLLRNDPKVCFEFDTLHETISEEKACDFGMRYHSVIGTGKAVFIESREEKCRALDMIMAQYSDREFNYPDNMLDAIAVIKVQIETITGKQGGL